MARTDQPAGGGGRLQRSQAERKSRILATVLDLAREGGYDAIQVRPVSDRTGVSSDTIYRYFGSRDRLISAAIADWVEREFFEPAPTWSEGDTPVEQLLSFLRHTWRVWEQNPGLLETFVRAALAEGGIEDGLSARGLRILLSLADDVLRDVEPGYRADVLMIIAHVTHSAMTFVVRDQLPVSEVYPRLERSVKRLAEHPAMEGQRPKAWNWKPQGSRRGPSDPAASGKKPGRTRTRPGHRVRGRRR